MGSSSITLLGFVLKLFNDWTAGVMIYEDVSINMSFFHGLTISSVGHYSVRAGHTVYINDSNIFRTQDDANLSPRELRHQLHVRLRIFSPDTELPTGIASDSVVDLSVTGYTALFGADLSAPHNLNATLTSILRPEGVSVRHEELNRHGCVPFERSYPDSALVVHRGQCTFLEKLLYARAASASAIIVISDDNLPVNPTANPDELEAAGDLSNAAVILLQKKTGEALEDMVITTSKLGSGIRISVDREEHGDSRYSKPLGHTKDEEATRILYINGHPLINTRLLV